jgi:hypothetical protein
MCFKQCWKKIKHVFYQNAIFSYIKVTQNHAIIFVFPRFSIETQTKNLYHLERYFLPTGLCLDVYNT